VSVAEEVRAAERQLAAAGVPSPRHDAEALAAHILGVSRAELVGRDGFDAEQAAGFAELLARRVARVPLQHLTGRAPFRHLELRVGPGAFIPRPETEVLVDWVCRALSHLPGAVVVDLCAGPGPIALSIAHERPGSEVHAVERDPDAFEWLKRNALESAAAGDNAVTIHFAAAGTPLPQLDGRVDLVVANPPYVPDADLEHIDPEVRHDPEPSWYGGPDGLDVIPVVIEAAERLLHPGGLLAVEHSWQHREPVTRLLTDGGWDDVAVHPDLTGRDRFATARRGMA
jgi:release factor glutamine methyltransferase